MKKIINNWHAVSIGLAVIFVCLVFMGDWDARDLLL